MPAVAPSALDSTLLAQRLRELAGQERDVQVEFLLHLEEFDRRRAYVDAGYPSLWAYCLEVLHLREGAAGRRIQAMRVLRRFPSLEGALRDGRLCISTVQLLGQVLTEENLPDLVARAAYRTKAEVDHLVASLQARTAPRTGVRKLPDRAPAASAPALPLAAVDAGPAEPQEAIPAPAAAGGSLPPTVSALPDVPRQKARAETRAVSESDWSLRVTIDRGCKEDLDAHRAALAQDPGRRSRGGAPRGHPLRRREARQAQGRGRAAAAASAEGGPGPTALCRARRAHEHDPGDSAARGLEARRRTLRLGRSGRAALQQPLAAGARPHPPAGPGRTLDGREPPSRLQVAQPVARRTDLRARAHGSFPA
nr:HNH endonuclease [Anaeromyxobacter sp. Fw109-5]